MKVLISLVERNDWQDYFEVEKTKREQLDKMVKQRQQQLDEQVYKLFALTEDEISLLETQL